MNYFYSIFENDDPQNFIDYASIKAAREEAQEKEKAMEQYEYCKRMYANDNAVVKLTRAVQVYAGVLEYETIEKHSTFDESKINNEI